METRTVTHATYVIERTYPKSPEQVFAAFSQPDQKRRWFGNDRTEEFTTDFRVGGSDLTSSRMGENTPFPGVILTNQTLYQDIVDNSRIVFAYKMSLAGRCFSASLATVELFPEGGGTRLIFTDQIAFFEGSDGAEIRKAGWTDLLNRLAEAL